MYAHALLGAVAVIFDAAGHVLLVKQTYGDCNWALPGGYTEPHESVVETAVREVREETGLQVVADRLNGIYYGQQRDFHHFVFLCHTVGAAAEPRPCSSEVAACTYWPTDALPHPMNDLTRRFIRDAGAVEGTPALPVVVASCSWPERVETSRRRLVALAVLFNADGQVLLVKHTYGGRYWAYPGGFVEAQESITAAAARETWEETGLHVVAERLCGMYYSVELNSHIFVLICRQKDGNVAPTPCSPEVSACEYWSPGDLPEPMHDAGIRFLRDAVSGRPCTLPVTIRPGRWLEAETPQDCTPGWQADNG